MSFASDVRELRRGIFIVLETHIVMSLLIFHLVLTLVLCLVILLVRCLISLVDLTIAHMVLVHKIISLCLNALVTAHVLIVVIISLIGMVFLLEGLYTHLEPRHLDSPCLPHRGSRLIGSKGEV
jgi:membrane protein implicated in regulation of membrane protease activity